MSLPPNTYLISGYLQVISTLPNSQALYQYLQVPTRYMIKCTVTLDSHHSYQHPNNFKNQCLSQERRGQRCFWMLCKASGKRENHGKDYSRIPKFSLKVYWLVNKYWEIMKGHFTGQYKKHAAMLRFESVLFCSITHKHPIQGKGYKLVKRNLVV